MRIKLMPNNERSCRSPSVLKQRWRHRDPFLSTVALVSDTKYVARCIHRIAARLHTLTCHSPEKIVKKWQSAGERFNHQHFPSNARRVSYRTINEFSAHRFL